MAAESAETRKGAATARESSAAVSPPRKRKGRPPKDARKGGAQEQLEMVLERDSGPADAELAEYEAKILQDTRLYVSQGQSETNAKLLAEQKNYVAALVHKGWAKKAAEDHYLRTLTETSQRKVVLENAARDAIKAPQSYLSAVEQLDLPGVVPKTPGQTAPYSNDLARTSLFSPRQRKKRRILNEVELASPGGLSVRYTGPELDMSDQDVLLQAMRMAGNISPNTPIEINRAEFLRQLGRKSLSNGQYSWLEDSFFRLSKGHVIIETEKLKLGFPLLGSLELNKDTNVYTYTIPEKTLQMFAGKKFSYVDMQMRRQLTQKIDLAKWIQSYAVSHRVGIHRVEVVRLKELCGYKERLHKFRESLTVALNEWKRIEFFTHWFYYNNQTMVEWHRPRNFGNNSPGEECAIVIDTI